MTQQEALRRLREIGNEIELDQWQIIEDLRTRAPENQRELARELQTRDEAAMAAFAKSWRRE
jgi:hypothetical protein